MLIWKALEIKRHEYNIDNEIGSVSDLGEILRRQGRELHILYVLC